MANDDVNMGNDEYIEIKIPEETSRKESPPKAAIAPPAKQPVKKVAKKVVKKASPRKIEQRKPAKQSSSWIWVLLIVLGLIIIAIVVYLSIPKDAPAAQETKQVAALVNGKPIYVSQINEVYDSLPPQYQEQTSREMILDQLIEQELLMQEAEKEGITVTDEELDMYTDNLMNYFGLTQEQLTSMLEAQGMSMSTFNDNNRRQLKLSKLINKTIYSELYVTDEEVAAYYAQNLDRFAVPQAAVVRHILINPMENETDEQLRERSQIVADTIDDDFGNFCDLVTEFSNDTASAGTCGQYEVAQNGQYVPEFEQAAFDLDIDEVDIVKTAFGDHIIWKVGEQDASVQSLDAAKESIITLLNEEKSNQLILDYIERLRSAALIEKYPLDGTASSAPLPMDQEQVQDDVMDVVIEDTAPARAGNFGDCLSGLGAKLYGVSWSPDTAEQIEILGGSFEKIEYVDCDQSECADISTYPTWVIGDVVLEGKVSLTRLSEATGCQI